MDFQDNLTENLSDHSDEEITILDNAEVTIADDENEVEIEVVDLTLGTGHGRTKINITEPMQTKDVLLNIQKILYSSMFSYWKDIHKVGMLACLLDPRFKKLRFVKQRARYEVIENLRNLYENV